MKALSLAIAAIMAATGILFVAPAEAATRRVITPRVSSVPSGAIEILGRVTVRKGKKTIAKNRRKVILRKKGTYRVKSVVAYTIPEVVVPGAMVTRQGPSTQTLVDGTTTRLRILNCQTPRRSCRCPRLT